jgi:hypothetical protein
MNRCTHRLMAILPILLLLAATTSLPALAQTEDNKPTVREFPKAALRGELMVLLAPEITLDGKPERMAPGVRILDPQNQLVLSATLTKQPLLVNYLRDNTGQVQQVWLLSSEEARQKRPGQKRNSFFFGSDTASTPADDGKTPYDQLPRYQR